MSEQELREEMVSLSRSLYERGYAAEERGICLSESITGASLPHPQAPVWADSMQGNSPLLTQTVIIFPA